MAGWSFYGRRGTLSRLRGLVDGNAWFFCRIQGRRRIGKTSLLRELTKSDEALANRMFYVQIPDSSERDLATQFSRALADGPTTLIQSLAPTVFDFATMARAIAVMNKADIIVVLDEFQYFTAPQLFSFN